MPKSCACWPCTSPWPATCGTSSAACAPSATSNASATRAVNIAERGLLLLELAPLATPPRLEELADATRDFLTRTAACFSELDLDKARRLCDESGDILEHNVAILQEMAEYMRDAARPVERAVQVCFIAHGLKRVCDQCANIAESVMFIREGACSRHRRA